MAQNIANGPPIKQALSTQMWVNSSKRPGQFITGQRAKPASMWLVSCGWLSYGASPGYTITSLSVIFLFSFWETGLYYVVLAGLELSEICFASDLNVE